MQGLSTERYFNVRCYGCMKVRHHLGVAAAPPTWPCPSRPARPVVRHGYAPVPNAYLPPSPRMPSPWVKRWCKRPMQPWALQRWVAAMWRRRYPAWLAPHPQPQPEPMHTNGYQYCKRLVPSTYVPYRSTAGVGQYGRKKEESAGRWRGCRTLQYPPNLLGP
jgi:hypothetical protein